VDNSEFIFQVVSNQPYNYYLKKLQSILKTVSELLGQPSMAVTQEYYEKVIQKNKCLFEIESKEHIRILPAFAKSKKPPNNLEALAKLLNKIPKKIIYYL